MRVGEGDRETLTICLTGDVMTGRGVDQILPHPCDPRLHEPYARCALDYVHLAERRNGPIPRPVGFDYVWGEARGRLAREAVDCRIINLETAITADGTPEPKGINYRMSPANIGVLSGLPVDACTLANNHVLDWGEGGLRDTLEALTKAGIRHAGAGRDALEAAAPAVLTQGDGKRILLFGYGCPSSGIPLHWAAAARRPGVNLLADLSDAALARMRRQVEAFRRPGDVLIASIHWGSNWGYEIRAEQRHFAHRLIGEIGFHLVHGHSSHHAKAVELFEERPILYGCGDFLNDYEGIEGYETYRDDLAIAYLARFRREGNRLESLRLLPFRIRRFRLEAADPQDRDWLRGVLDRESRRFGTTLIADGGNAFLALPTSSSGDPRHAPP